MTWTPPGYAHRQVDSRYDETRVRAHFAPDDPPAPLGLILHVQVGPGSPFGWFSESKSSSTWWAGREGQREQYIDPDTERSWTQAAGNWDYHSIETEGYPADEMTGEQLESVAQTLAAGHERYGWPLKLADKPGDKGLGWHGMGGVAWGNHPDCPGNKRRAQMPAVIARAQEITAGEETAAMTVTSNGWAVRSSYAASFVAPTGNTCQVVNKDMATVFAYLAWRLSTEVLRPATGVYGARTRQQQIDLYRKKGLAPVLDSNHISGTAIDVFRPGVQYEPDQRARGQSYRSGYTAAEEKAIRAICRDTSVIQWGGDFPARTGQRDPGHYQLTQDFSRPYRRVVSAAKLAAEAKKVATFVKGVQQAVGVTQDGIAGPGTIKALRAWQKRHSLVADAIWGPKSQAAAGVKAPAKKPAKPKPATPGGANIQKGDRGGEVIGWQNFLNARPHVSGTLVVDGIFGDAVEAATKQWQRNNHLTADGIVGPKSKKKRDAQARSWLLGHTRKIREGDRGVAVMYLQTYLNSRPHTKPWIVPDQVFGADTRKALKSFQSNNHLTPDAVWGPDCRAKAKRLG